MKGAKGQHKMKKKKETTGHKARWSLDFEMKSYRNCPYPPRFHEPATTPTVNSGLCPPSCQSALAPWQTLAGPPRGHRDPMGQEGWKCKQGHKLALPVPQKRKLQAALSQLKMEKETDFTFYGKSSKEYIFCEESSWKSYSSAFHIDKNNEGWGTRQAKAAAVRFWICHQRGVPGIRAGPPPPALELLRPPDNYSP